MRAEKRACEETGAAEAATLREDFERSVADVYGRARDTLEASEEARRVRELETQLAFAAKALHARRSAPARRGRRVAEALRVDYDAGRRALRADRKRKLDELHDEHQNSAVGGALTLAAGSTPPRSAGTAAGVLILGAWLSAVAASSPVVRRATTTAVAA